MRASLVTSPEGAIGAGVRVDRYRVIGRVGGSGMGVVFAAEDEVTGERVALKTLRAWSGEDATQVARFEREARAANELDHPAIVRVLATGVLADGRPYLVLPLLEGRTLAEAIAADGPLAPGVAWRMVRPVGEALAEAHGRGILHRDVKPGNVFLVRGSDGAESPKLLDFGLARPVTGDGAEEAAKLTQTGDLVGTPLYMAPEQCWGLPPGPGVDQYAFGVTVFEVLTGRPPFDGPSFAALLQKHLHAPPPALVVSGAPLGAELEGFVHRLLAKEPADRFASMEEALAAGDVAFGQPARERVATEKIGGAPAELAVASSGSVTSIGSVTSSARVTSSGPVAASASIGPYLAWHVGAIVVGALGLLIVGYAGEDRHQPYQWFRIGGWPQVATVIWFSIAAVAFPILARRRAGALPGGVFVLAFVPAISGILSTYPNWQAIERGVSRVGGLEAFQLFCQGTYESNASRFVGYALASVLCLSLVAAPLATSARPEPGRSAALPVAERRASMAGLFALVALALAASLLGAPSGALVASTGAGCLLASLLFASRGRALSPGAEIARAAAALLAVGLAFTVGVARVEGRQAVLWVEPATRAARVLEILDARAEMNATLLIGAAALVGTLAPHVFSLAPALRSGWPKLSRAAWIAAGVLVAAAGLDVVLRERLLGRREELRAELAAQFATFIHLDPPSAGALDPVREAPRRSTGLQIARDALAINGRGVAKLAALDTESGVFHVTAALHQALAQAAVERGEDEVDLAVTADESVAFGTIVRLLGIARAGGARRVDLLFRRGPRPVLATGGPPEIAYVVPSDFAVATAELADSGFTAPPEQRWSAVAPALLERFSAGGPLLLQTPTTLPTGASLAPGR